MVNVGECVYLSIVNIHMMQPKTLRCLIPAVKLQAWAERWTSLLNIP